MMNSFVFLLFGVCIAATCVSASIPVSFASVTVLGNQSDTHLAGWTLSRDGGAVGSLGGKIVWFFSDTTYFYNGVWKLPFFDNTVAVGHADQPLNVTTPQKYGIPYTTTENNFNSLYSNSPRIVLWPKSGVVEVTPGKGYIWIPKGYYGSNPNKVATPNAGIVLASVTIGSDGYPSVARVSDVPFFPTSGPDFGSLASAKDSTYVYLYSCDNRGSSNFNVFVARVPIAQASVFSAFEYYHKSSSSWSSVSPAIADTTDAVFSQYLGLNGNIYYSTYHGLWLMFYSVGGDHIIYYSSAPAPQGPWSAGSKVYTAPLPPPPATYIYGTSGNNLYDATGKSVYIQFSWPYPGGYSNWVVQANFE